MPITIKVNNLSLVHSGSGGVSRATLPDVCKTPPSMMPVPYPNITFSRDLADGTSTVNADGGRMIAVKGSIFTPSTGDEPGAGGGVKSGTHKKESRWLTYSMDVKIEGRNACRLTDKKLHNHGNTMNAGGETQKNVDETSTCDWENRDGALVGAGGPPCGCAPGDSTKLQDVAPVTPPGCENKATLRQVVYVNGILTEEADHCNSLKEIASRRCVAVTGVYNESEGFFKDLTQCVKDKLGIGNNPANDTLREVIEGQLRAGQPLEVMAHSQGALIASRAIGDVANGAAIGTFRAGGAGMDLSLLTVNTYGGAAWTYPPGPTYNHTVNAFDPVPLLFGRSGFARGALMGGLQGALRGGFWGGLWGAAVGGVSALMRGEEDLTLIKDLALNPHSFIDIYLENIAPGPCQCEDARAV